MSTQETEKKTSNSENFKNALCYVPLGAIVMFFGENKKTDTLRKNIKYGLILFWIYAILNIFLWWLIPRWILFLVYAWISIFFGMKAYSWESVEIDYIDDLEQKVKDKM